MAGWACARGRRAAGHMVHASAKGLYHAEAATLTTANEIVLDFGPRPTAKIANVAKNGLRLFGELRTPRG
jgi:hypothetical protein